MIYELEKNSKTFNSSEILSTGNTLNDKIDYVNHEIFRIIGKIDLSAMSINKKYEIASNCIDAYYIYCYKDEICKEKGEYERFYFLLCDGMWNEKNC